MRPSFLHRTSGPGQGCSIATTTQCSSSTLAMQGRFWCRSLRRGGLWMYEAEYVRVMVEVGWLGWLAWYAFRLYILCLLWRTFMTLSSPRLRLWALAALLTHLISLWSGVVLNHVFAVYAWFLDGFALLLPKLDAAESNPHQVAEL